MYSEKYDKISSNLNTTEESESPNVVDYKTKTMF